MLHLADYHSRDIWAPGVLCDRNHQECRTPGHVGPDHRCMVQSTDSGPYASNCLRSRCWRDSLQMRCIQSYNHVVGLGVHSIGFFTSSVETGNQGPYPTVNPDRRTPIKLLIAGTFQCRSKIDTEWGRENRLVSHCIFPPEWGNASLRFGAGKFSRPGRDTGVLIGRVLMHCIAS